MAKPLLDKTYRLFFTLCISLSAALILFKLMPQGTDTSLIAPSQIERLEAYPDVISSLHFLPSWQAGTTAETSGIHFLEIAPLQDWIALGLSSLEELTKKTITPFHFQLFLACLGLIFLNLVSTYSLIEQIPLLLLFFLGGFFGITEFLAHTFQTTILAASTCWLALVVLIATLKNRDAMILKSLSMSILVLGFGLPGVIYFLPLYILSLFFLPWKNAISAFLISMALTFFYIVPIFTEQNFVFHFQKLNAPMILLVSGILIIAHIPTLIAKRYSFKQPQGIFFDTAVIPVLALSLGLFFISSPTAHPTISTVSAISKQEINQGTPLLQMHSGVSDITCRWLNYYHWNCSVFAVKASQLILNLPHAPRWQFSQDKSMTPFTRHIVLQPGVHELDWVLKPTPLRMALNMAFIVTLFLLASSTLRSLWLRLAKLR